MNRASKIFLVCLFSAFIGTFFGLGVWPGSVFGVLFWAVVFSGLAYLSYDWRKVILAVPQAFKAAISWRPKRNQILLGLARALLICILVFYFFTFFAFLVWLDIVDHESRPAFLDVVLSKVFLITWAFFSFVFGVVGFCFGVALEWEDVEYRSPYFQNDYLKQAYGLLLVISPPVILCWYLPKIIFYHFIWQMVIKAAIGRFFVHFVKLIHSESRLICAFYSFVGILIGCFTGWRFDNIWFGGVVGGLCAGISARLTYELISRRLLHTINGNEI